MCFNNHKEFAPRSYNQPRINAQLRSPSKRLICLATESGFKCHFTKIFCGFLRPDVRTPTGCRWLQGFSRQNADALFFWRKKTPKLQTAVNPRAVQPKHTVVKMVTFSASNVNVGLVNLRWVMWATVTGSNKPLPWRKHANFGGFFCCVFFGLDPLFCVLLGGRVFWRCGQWRCGQGKL